jgi:hypothetical protein
LPTRIVVKDRYVELGEVFRVGDKLDSDDVPIGHGERECPSCLSAGSPDGPCGSIDQCQACAAGPSGELRRDRTGAVEVAGSTGLPGRLVGAEYDIGVQQRQQRGEVAVAADGRSW